MWQRQTKAIQKLPASEQAKDPREQYIHDLSKLITQLKYKKYQIIIAGDANINLHKQSHQTKAWKEMMHSSNMVNTMATWWPNITHKLVTWGGKSWIDHIYI